MERFEKFKAIRSECKMDLSDFEPELLEGRDEPITTLEEFDLLERSMKDWVESGRTLQEFSYYEPYDLADVEALLIMDQRDAAEDEVNNNYIDE